MWHPRSNNFKKLKHPVTNLLLILLLTSLTACTTQKTSLDLDESPQFFTLYSASTTEKWVPLVYDCATRAQFGLVSRVPDIDTADISLHIGAAENGYKIDSVELLVIGNAKNPITELTGEEVFAIFTGKLTNWAQINGDDALIQVWVYDALNDLQIAFGASLPDTGTISTMAHQAQNTQEMREEIAKDIYAIGISTQAEIGANLHTLHSFGEFPVLAIVKDEPNELIFSVINCLQEK